MKVTYLHVETNEEMTLDYDPYSGRWSGPDLPVVQLLNHSVATFLSRSEYYPTYWHKVKDVADELGGTVDEPEPKFPSGDHPGVVY